GSEIASTAVGGFHFTERVSVRFHLRAAPEDFTFCRQAKDFTLLTFGPAFVLLAEVCDKKPAEIRASLSLPQPVFIYCPLEHLAFAAFFAERNGAFIRSCSFFCIFSGRACDGGKP
ncbi:MAG: hypothetical protein II776_00175, partial [Clostridia bacterium]|nr:hypothetical protein [Clostridia bacterium]